MEEKNAHSAEVTHEPLKEQYDDAYAQGLHEQGGRRMAVYHAHCQDPVIFRTLGDLHGKSLLDLACGDGFFTRRFREAGASPVTGVDLSPEAIDQAKPWRSMCLTRSSLLRLLSEAAE